MSVSSFGYHNAAIDSHGVLFTWGKKYLPQTIINSHFNCLGHSDQKDYLSPTVVSELAKHKSIAVGCGEDFTVVSAVSSKSNEKFSQ